MPGKADPVDDESNAYRTTFNVEPDGSVVFRSVRPLAPSDDPRAYVIELDKPIDMIAVVTDSVQITAEEMRNYHKTALTISSGVGANVAGEKCYGISDFTGTFTQGFG